MTPFSAVMLTEHVPVPEQAPLQPAKTAGGVAFATRTTVVDAGSAGAHTFPGLKEYVVRVADTRVYALLNISVVGQSTFSNGNPFGELLSRDLASPPDHHTR